MLSADQIERCLRTSPSAFAQDICKQALAAIELLSYKNCTQLALSQIYRMFEPPLVGTVGIKGAILKLRERIIELEQRGAELERKEKDDTTLMRMIVELKQRVAELKAHSQKQYQHEIELEQRITEEHGKALRAVLIQDQLYAARQDAVKWADDVETHRERAEKAERELAELNAANQIYEDLCDTGQLRDAHDQIDAMKARK